MKKARQTEGNYKKRPAITPEARESQLISLATDLAEKQLVEGTASAQVITHYLKLASMKEKYMLEEQKLREENKLLQAKTQAIENAKKVEDLYIQAMNAMKLYSGEDNDDEYFDD